MTSQGLVDSLKKLSKENGKEYTDAEARDGAERLVGFYRLLIKVDQRNKQRDHEKSKKI
jgi:hypothetical protein